MNKKLHLFFAAAFATALCTAAPMPLQAQEATAGENIENTFSTTWYGPDSLMAGAIVNGNFTDNSGWNGIGTVNYGAVEFFQKSFDMSQTITGLEPGYYRVKANAFQRVGSNDGGAAYEAGNEIITAMLYIQSGEQESSMPFLSLYTNNLYEGRYADNMAEAAYAFGLGKYEISTDPIQVGEDGTLTIGAYENTLTNNNRWCILSNVRLYKVDVFDSTDEIEAYMATAAPHSPSCEDMLNDAIAALQTLVEEEASEEELSTAADAVNAALWEFLASETEYAEFGEEIEMAKEMSKQFTELSGYPALLEAIAKAEAAFNNNPDDPYALGEELADALKACILTGTDFTFFIENPSFEDLQIDRATDIPGWTKTGPENSEFCTRNDAAGLIFTTADDSTHYYSSGNVYFQYWTANALPDFALTQTLPEEIPNGKYRITAAGDFSGSGFYLTANGNQTAIDSTGDFTVEALVTDGTLTIGVKTEGATGNWARADHFRLTYLGDPNPAPTEPATGIDESTTYYIYHPAADKFMANNDAATNGALYTMGALENEKAYQWEVTLTPAVDANNPDTVSFKQLASGQYLNALTTNGWAMGLGAYDIVCSRYIINEAEGGTYTLSNLHKTTTMIGFDNLNDGSTPYYDKGTGNNPYFKFYKVDEYEEYAPLLPYYQQKEELRERINEMKDLQDGILGGYHSEEDEKGLAATLAYALEIYEQTADAVALDSLTAAVGIVDNAIETYKYSTLATKDNPADYTFAIANADAELASAKNIPGWTLTPAEIGNWGSKAVDNEVLTGQSIEAWNAQGSTYNVSITQAISNLPNGIYSLSVGAFAADQANKENTGSIYFFANSKKVDIEVSNPAGTDEEVVNAAQVYTIENIVVNDGTLQIGMQEEACNANWFGFDNVHLTYYGPKETLLILTDSVTRTTDAGYNPTYIYNHSAEICEFLGVDSLTDASVSISGMNANDSLLAETASYDGWRDAEGNFITWGDDAVICVKFPNGGDDTDNIFICNMPDTAAEGDQYVTRWAVTTATDTVIVRTVITMEAPAMPDITSPEQCTLLGTFNFEVEAEADNAGYTPTAISVDTEAIATLFGIEAGALGTEASLYALDGESLFATTSTANNGGYWFDATGVVTAWGTNSTFFIEPLAAGDYSTLNIGQFPATCAPGDVYEATLYLVIGDQMVALEVTYTIADEATGIETTTAEAEVVTTEYYTPDGIRIDTPAEGVTIVRETLSDGTVRSYKQLNK